MTPQKKYFTDRTPFLFLSIDSGYEMELRRKASPIAPRIQLASIFRKTNKEKKNDKRNSVEVSHYKSSIQLSLLLQHAVGK